MTDLNTEISNLEAGEEVQIEFTDGERRVGVVFQNDPANQIIRFNDGAVTVEYSEIAEIS